MSADTPETRWNCLREVITGMQGSSLTLAAEFPGSDDLVRVDALRLVLRAMNQLEEHFPVQVNA